MSLADLAEEIGLSYQTQAKRESGAYRTPAAELKIYAEALGCKVTDFLS